MTAYVIARIEVTNLEAYKEYAAQTVAIAESFGGKFLVKAGAFEQIEGSGPDRHVVIEMPDVATAKKFYNSDVYQAILPLALNNSNRDLVIVEGA
jgi:uncharacterized protein (DUF1330 family)